MQLRIEEVFQKPVGADAAAEQITAQEKGVGRIFSDGLQELLVSFDVAVQIGNEIA